VHPDVIRQRFNRLVTRLKLPPIRLHDLRHSYATAALAAGAHPKIVSEPPGHASVAFTLTQYWAGRVLLGGIPPEPNELERRQLGHAFADLLAPVDDSPSWATVGVQLTDELISARPTLDLDEAEATDVRQWPQ
jgi:hypothetical protein